MIDRFFVDTTALVAYFDGSDVSHRTAKELVARTGKQKNRMVVTDFILDESITVIKSRVGHGIAVKSGEFVLQSQVIDIIWLDQDVLLKAWEYFKKHSDKGYSFTDCTSFVLMKELGLKYCLSFDRHYEQAGFRLYS
jgi:uncharacterized protein